MVKGASVSHELPSLDDIDLVRLDSGG